MRIVLSSSLSVTSLPKLLQLNYRVHRREKFFPAVFSLLSWEFRKDKQPQDILKKECLSELLFSEARCAKLLEDDTVLESVRVNGTVFDGDYHYNRHSMYARQGTYQDTRAFFFIGLDEPSEEWGKANGKRWWMFVEKRQQVFTSHYLFHAPYTASCPLIPPKNGWQPFSNECNSCPELPTLDYEYEKRGKKRSLEDL